MSSVAFTLHVPSGAPHRDLAGEVAARYLEIRGGAGPAAAAFATEVVQAVGELAASTPAVDLVFSTNDRQVEVEISGGGATRRVQRAL